MANKNILPPTKERKSDTSKNGNDLTKYIQRQLKRERNLYPLRINATTVIYVTKAKCTKEYAEKYKREKMKL